MTTDSPERFRCTHRGIDNDNVLFVEVSRVLVAYYTNVHRSPVPLPVPVCAKELLSHQAAG